MSIDNFLDEEGRVKIWPKKQADKQSVCEYLATKFDTGKTYDESEVNEIIKKWHTFQDWALLRRELFERHLLNRNRNGSDYTRIIGK